MKNKSNIIELIMKPCLWIAYIIFAILYTIIFVSTFVEDVNVFYKLNMFKALVLSVFTIIIWIILYKAIERLSELLGRKTRIFFILLTFIAIFSIITVIAVNLEIPLGWDYEVVYLQAKSYVETGNRLASGVYPEYLQFFPNNIATFLIDVVILKIAQVFNIENSINLLVAFNGMLIFAAILFMYLFVKNKYGNVKAYFSLLISMCFIPLFAYVPIFYSDTFSLPIVTFLLLLYSMTDFNKLSYKNITKILLFSIALFIGIKVKMTVIFVAIGIVIDIVYNLKINKKIITNLSIMLGSFIILFLMWGQVFENRFDVNSYGSIPLTHWIMMGIEDPTIEKPARNSYGGYNEEDYKITLSYETGEASKGKHIQEIGRRIKNHGLVGYLNYLNKKNTNIWGDGSYFSTIALSVRSHNNKTDFQKILTGNDEGKVLVYIEQGVNLSFLMIFVFSCVCEIKNKKYENLAIHIPICLLYLFLTFWEARSRYVYNFIPLYIMIIVLYIDKFGLMFENMATKCKSIILKGADKDEKK